MPTDCAGASKPLEQRPTSPSVVHRKRKTCFSFVLYKGRNCIERFFNSIKHFRRIATRYEKHAANFLAMLKLD